MPPPRWEQIEAYFEDAIALPLPERRAFLERLAAQDPELHAEVVSLLAAHADADGYFEGLSDRFVSPLMAKLEQEVGLPERVGPYRIVRKLGVGGMSVVYLAERDDGQFQQEVALKLIRSSQAEKHARRFLGERQILASLNHPHIARLFDGGVAEDGRPYFVMEYVDGVPLDAYCDQQRLPIRERVRLLLTVAEAVQYAHQNLIIHRDLKPSNILVAGAAGQPMQQAQVKLLDFGIAKLLGAEGETPLHTRTGARWMTPEYAAPEQVRGEAVTTATDVYQLGVVLYKLLTGHRPYRLEDASTYEMERAVCEQPPTRPSTIVARSEEIRRGETTTYVTPEQVSHDRATDVAALRETLAGDLDAIVLKALRKEPGARYATVDAFADDLRRFLNGHAVAARRGTRRYRMHKFIQRHRWGVAAAAAVLLLIIGFASLYAVRITQERNRAQLEAEKAQAVSEFLISVFEQSDPDEARGDTATAQVLLARGARRVEQALARQPRVQAQMLRTVGRVYEGLGSYAEAEQYLERALALHRQQPGGPAGEMAETLRYLAGVYTSQGRLAAAAPLYEEAVMLWRDVPGPQEKEAETLVEQAAFLQQRNDLDAAEALLAEARDMQRDLFGTEHEDLARTLTRLGDLRAEQDDYAAAVQNYEDALAMARRLLGERHPIAITTLGNLAGIRMRQGRYAAADSLYTRTLDLQRQVLGPAHPDVAKALNNLALLREHRGDLDAAEVLQRQALAIKREHLGASHPSLAVAYVNLAGLVEMQGDLTAAEALYRQALQIDEAVYGSRHPEVAADRTRLGAVLHAQGQRAEARTHLEQALAIWETAPDERIRRSTTLLAYARLLRDERAHDRAEALAREAVQLRAAVLDEGHWGIAEARGEVGAALAARGRPAEATSLLVASREVLAEQFGAAHPRTQRIARYLAALQETRANESAAEAF
jgi:serine/threonine-protein kinase